MTFRISFCNLYYSLLIFQSAIDDRFSLLAEDVHIRSTNKIRTQSWTSICVQLGKEPDLYVDGIKSPFSGGPTKNIIDVILLLLIQCEFIEFLYHVLMYLDILVSTFIYFIERSHKYKFWPFEGAVYNY